MVLSALFCGWIPSQQDNSEKTILHNWEAGKTVSDAAIKTYGEHNCFVAEPIPDNIWELMQGKSYKDNPFINREDLRHIKVLHWDYDNKIHLGEMVCNKAIANILIDIFRQLYKAKYPIERMILPDYYDADDETQMRANNSSCFCYRAVAGTKVISHHARGLAIDINTLYNPYYKIRKDGSMYVQPETGRPYCDRSKNFKYKIDKKDLAYKLFTQNGFKWGGEWKSCKDFQHFEWEGK